MEAAQVKQNKPIKNKQPTALVVGGAGFVGSHLCETLISQNFEVICIDNLSTGKKENLKDILSAPNFTFIEANINDPNFRLGEGVKIDYCFHTASIEEYKPNKNISLDTLLVNSLGTRQLLEISKEHKAKFILFSSADLHSGAISSSSLRYYFGKSPEGEEILSTHEAKRFAEALTFEYFKKFDLEALVIRLKDVYGPRMNLDRGDDIANLLKNAVNKENLKVFGDGLNIINPTFISDVIFGTIKASIGNFNGEIFILVNGDKVTLESFAQTIKLVSGPLEIENKKTQDSFELPSYRLDLENTKEKLSWNPKVTLAEGIASVIHSKLIKDSKESDKAETKLDEVKIVKAVESEEKTNKIVSESGQKSKKAFWLRIAIFSFSLILLTFTIFYPIGSMIASSFLASKDLQDATVDLNLAHNELAVANSLKAQNNFGNAEQSLQNINWLLKIVGLSSYSANLDRVFGASINLAASVRSTAKASQILIDTAVKEDISQEEAQDKLDEALVNLYKSQETIEQGQLLLEEIDWSNIPAVIFAEKTFFSEELSSLSREVDQLISSIEKSLEVDPLE